MGRSDCQKPAFLEPALTPANAGDPRVLGKPVGPVPAASFAPRVMQTGSTLLSGEVMALKRPSIIVLLVLVLLLLFASQAFAAPYIGASIGTKLVSIEAGFPVASSIDLVGRAGLQYGTNMWAQVGAHWYPAKRLYLGLYGCAGMNDQPFSVAIALGLGLSPAERDVEREDRKLLFITGELGICSAEAPNGYHDYGILSLVLQF